MLKRLRFAILLAFATLFLTSVAAAQDVVIYGGSTNAREHGYQHGYRDGLRQGRADLNSNARANFESEDYQRADLGYEEYMGSRREFQAGYREGYRDGYEDGYNNRPIRAKVYSLDDNYDPDRVPRTEADARGYENWGYADVAMDTGYRDGLSAGTKDFRERKDYRPEKHDSYEDGDHGYRKAYGSKDQYKEAYRKGFLRGYDDAINRRGH